METHQEYDRMYFDWSTILGITTEEFKTRARDQHLNALLRMKSTFGTSALTIVDIEKNKYLYVDEDIEKVTGIKRERYFKKGPRYLLKKASFSHVARLVSSTLHQRQFFSKLDKHEKDRYVYNREFSYAGKPKRWVLHQVIQHLENTSGKIFAVAVLQTRIDTLKLDKRFRYYIFDQQKNGIVYPIPGEPPNAPIGITPREIEIMQLMVAGNTSKVIGDILGISFHTVRTHRKNIFKKLGCQNVLEMANKLNGILERSGV